MHIRWENRPSSDRAVHFVQSYNVVVLISRVLVVLTEHLSLSKSVVEVRYLMRVDMVVDVLLEVGVSKIYEGAMRLWLMSSHHSHRRDHTMLLHEHHLSLHVSVESLWPESVVIIKAMCSHHKVVGWLRHHGHAFYGGVFLIRSKSEVGAIVETHVII